MTAPTLVRGGRCLHCQGEGVVRRVVCRICHGDGCARCDGTGVIEAPGLCRRCKGSGRVGPMEWGLP